MTREKLDNPQQHQQIKIIFPINIVVCYCISYYYLNIEVLMFNLYQQKPKVSTISLLL